MKNKLKALTLKACINQSVHWFTVGLIAPIMTLFLIDKGLSLTQIAFGLAIYSGTVLLLEIPTGGFADLFGRKKVYSFSILFFIVYSLLLIIGTDYHFLLLCFVFQGVSRALFSGTMNAYFVDEFLKIDPNINLQKIMAKVGFFIPFSLGLGSLVGGLLPIIIGPYTKLPFANSIYTGNYIVFIILLIIHLITTNIYIKEETKNSGLTIFAGVKKVPDILTQSVNFGLKNKVIVILLFAGFAWGFSISGLESLWQPRVKGIIGDNPNTFIFGLLTAGYFFASSLGNIIITPISKYFKNNYPLVLFLSRLIMGLAYFFLALQFSILPFTFFYVFLYMCNGLQESPESAIFNREIPSSKRSTLMSFSSLFMQSGGIVGSLLLGILADTKSIKLSWLIASAVLTISAFLYLIIPIVKRRSVEIKEQDIA